MKKTGPSDLERLAIRERPDGQPVMHQTWGKLLFMHWRIPEEALRPLIPERLQIDTFDGSAWIAVTPFEVTGLRAHGVDVVERVALHVGAGPLNQNYLRAKRDLMGHLIEEAAS
jgi:hypothetical protein